MNTLIKMSNKEIATLVLFETKESAEKILKECFPKSDITVSVFSNNDAFVTIGKRKIKIKSKKVV